jgi:hypothetical protein
MLDCRYFVATKLRAVVRKGGEQHQHQSDQNRAMRCVMPAMLPPAQATVGGEWKAINLNRYN